MTYAEETIYHITQMLSSLPNQPKPQNSTHMRNFICESLKKCGVPQPQRKRLLTFLTGQNTHKCIMTLLSNAARACYKNKDKADTLAIQAFYQMCISLPQAPSEENMVHGKAYVVGLAHDLDHDIYFEARENYTIANNIYLMVKLLYKGNENPIDQLKKKSAA
jgi:hypothetical protein